VERLELSGLTCGASLGQNTDMRRSLCLVLLTGLCLAAFSAAAQQTTPATSDKSQSAETSSGRRALPKPSASKSNEKPPLADVTRVSTAEAARKAAKDAAQGRSSDAAPQASGASDVLEFRAGSPDAQNAAVTAPKESKKSAWKKVHGDAYGALGGRGAGKQAGGSVGATSKSGKSSVYVQTDRETTPAPH
jgi:hypothetical protein